MKLLSPLTSKSSFKSFKSSAKSFNFLKLTKFCSDNTGRIKIGDLIDKLKEIGYYIPPDSKIMKLYQEDK